MLNDARMAQGKKALGPMNQLIYQHPKASTDITKGTNTGGGGCQGCGGFPAPKGWDPVTGPWDGHPKVRCVDEARTLVTMSLLIYRLRVLRVRVLINEVTSND